MLVICTVVITFSSLPTKNNSWKGEDTDWICLAFWCLVVLVFLEGCTCNTDPNYKTLTIVAELIVGIPFYSSMMVPCLQEKVSDCTHWTKLLYLENCNHG